MTIEEDFAFLGAWLSERGGERAKAALSRIEAVVRAHASVQGAVKGIIEERDALRAAVVDAKGRLMDGHDRYSIANALAQALARLEDK